MTIKRITSALVVVAALLVGASNANAKPLDVDCDLLAATNDAVNDFLVGEGVRFDNLGDIVSSAIQDEVVLDQYEVVPENRTVV